MFIYAVVFLAILAVFLFFFWQYIATYEKTRNNTVMQTYIDELDDEKKAEIANKYLEGSENPSYANDYAVTLIANELEDMTFAKAVTESSDKTTVYMLKNANNTIGKVSMTKEDDPPLSFGPWNITNEEYDFSYLWNKKDVTVPSTYTVLYDGKEVNEETLKDNSIKIELLEDYYDTYDLPYLSSYRIEGIIDPEKISFLDQNGNPSDGSYSDSDLLNNASEADVQGIKEFVPPFLERYIQCLSNSNHDAQGNYNALAPYMVPNSNISNRVYEAIEGQYWAPSNGDTVTDINTNFVMHLGDNLYMADITYGLDTFGNAGLYHSENTARIFIQKSDGGYLASDIATY